MAYDAPLELEELPPMLGQLPPLGGVVLGVVLGVVVVVLGVVVVEPPFAASPAPAPMLSAVATAATATYFVGTISVLLSRMCSSERPDLCVPPELAKKCAPERYADSPALAGSCSWCRACS
jgi:hypothetical protein